MRPRLRVGLLAVSGMILLVLFILHGAMSHRLDEGELRGFYPWHRAYLIASTLPMGGERGYSGGDGGRVVVADLWPLAPDWREGGSVMRRGRRGGLLVVLLVIAMRVGTASAAEPATAKRPVALVPRISGEWWPVAGNPDLGTLTGERQQPVDFAVWQAADGTWQLWSCIRHTKCGGKTRLLFGWEGKEVTSRDWKPRGITMQADPNVGETAGGLQAPHVIERDGQFLLYYGDWQHIGLATGTDGKTFNRRMNKYSGTSGLFGEHPGSNTRDAMVLESGGRLYCYYTAYPEGRGAVYCRISEGDPATWGPSRVVAAGGAAGSGPFSAECPHVVERERDCFTCSAPSGMGRRRGRRCTDHPTPWTSEWMMIGSW